MTATPAVIKVAFIGMGPRGLGALEALVECCLEQGKAVELSLFNDRDLCGSGPNFAPDQTDLGMLNTPVRDLQIPPSLDLPCSGFQDWLKCRGQPDEDHFATRAELGQYLQDRFQDVVARAKSNLTLTYHQAHVTSLEFDNGSWRVSTPNDTFWPFDEVLLVAGQPKTKTDKQWASWIDHATNSDAWCLRAYPDRQFFEVSNDFAGRNVGIRGLGLSTFDVLRYLTLGQGGRFEDGVYQRSGREPDRIFAFSLNGQPPFPKPIDAAHDQRFDLTKPEKDGFCDAIQGAVDLSAGNALERICAALVTPAKRIGAEMGAGYSTAQIQEWLQIECRSPGDQETQAPFETLMQGIAMAEGLSPPTVGYVIGQIWRKVQNELRIGFNSARKSPESAQAIVAFDEGLKRYSYGPPLGSARELAALIKGNLVSLSVVDDPSITLVENGWRLFEGDEALVSIMVDAVLPPPSLAKITDPVFQHLRSQNRLDEMYEGSGAMVLPDGQVVNGDNEVSQGLCLLGRLALGSVIAVDSIHDCFGASTLRWAEGVLRRAQG